MTQCPSHRCDRAHPRPGLCRSRKHAADPSAYPLENRLGTRSQPYGTSQHLGNYLEHEIHRVRNEALPLSGGDGLLEVRRLGTRSELHLRVERDLNELLDTLNYLEVADSPALVLDELHSKILRDILEDDLVTHIGGPDKSIFWSEWPKYALELHRRRVVDGLAVLTMESGPGLLRPNHGRFEIHLYHDAH